MEERRSGYLIITLLCLIVVVAAAVFFGGGRAKKSPVPENTDEAAVTAKNPQISPPSSSEPSPPVSESPKPRSNGGVPDIPAAAAAEDSFFSDAVFVGNSLVDGLYLYGGVPVSHWLSGTGVSLYNIDKQKISDKAGGSCTVMQGLAVRRYAKVYIELGINEISMKTEDFSKSYGDFIDKIRDLQPEADIYVMSLTPVSQKKSSSGGYFTKANIEAYNKALYKLCADKNCWYLDSCTPLAGKDGYLPADATSDGIHFNPSYYSQWMDVIRTHYV